MATGVFHWRGGEGGTYKAGVETGVAEERGRGGELGAGARPARSGGRLWAGAVLIFLITLTVYWPVLRGGFVFDDCPLIVDNGMVRAGDGVRMFWSGRGVADYYPLTGTMWWLEWRLWGEEATGWHVLNVLLHATNAVLVWVILRRLNVAGAWLAAVVFAIHPVNVATAGWVSEQKNTLSMLFYCAAILAWLRFEAGGRWRWYGAALGAFVLAVLSKTAVVMLPVVLLGCVWWMRGRLRREDWLSSVPFFALSVIFGFITVSLQYHRVLRGTTFRPEGFLVKVAEAGWAVWFYAGKVVWPVNLSVIYPKWSVDAARWTAWLPLLFLGVGLVGLGRVRRGWGRAGLFGLGYFVAMLFPVLGFFDQGFYDYSLVADHWQYYSIIGIIALTVAAGAGLCRRIGERGGAFGVAASVAVLVALSVATWTRAGIYAASETLWLDTVTKNPDAWMAQYNLGLALGKDGKIEAAIAHFRQAVRLKPNFAEAHNYLGTALLQAGKTQDAIEQYRQALWIRPDYVEAQVNLDRALSIQSSASR